MRKKLFYKEGDWFAVPLRRGGYAVGNVARMRKSGVALFGYFFGPRHSNIPSLDEIKNLRAEQAVERYRFGDLGLIEEKWPVIGSPEIWEREKWPMPAFYRKDPFDKDHHRRVVYSDMDPLKEILEESVPYKMVKDLPEDGDMGYGAVEIDLDQKLK